jgi:hypothetical protein
MRTQHLFAALTAVNFALLLFLLSRTASVEAEGAPSVLRGNAIEIVDSEGRLRASLHVEPAGADAKGEAYPETVLFRLIDGSGQPSVKISTSGIASGLSLVGGDDEGYVVLQADGPQSSLKLVGPDGRERLVTP